MALTDTYTSPLDFETPEEKRKRERNKFRIMSTPILDAFQKKAAQGQVQVESFKFRQNASQFQQSNQEVQKFRQKVLDSGLLHQRFTPGAPSASGASQAAKEAADQEITRMGGEYWKRPENSQRYDELTSIIEGKAPAKTGEPPLPGVVGKIPGFRTPAEAAATIGTVGIGTTGTLGRRALQAGAQTLLGSGGAAVGGPAAEKVGAPAWTGELALGLGGAAGGRAWADNAATAFSREAPNAPTLARRLATEEAGGTKLPKRRIEGTAPEPGTPLESGIQKLNQALRGSKAKRNATEQIRSGQRASRSGAYGATLEAEIKTGVDPFEANKIASSKLKGAYEEQPGIQVDWTPEERQAVGMRILGNDIRNFERKNAFTALERLSEGKPITDYYVNLLGRIYGPELAQSIRESGKKGGFNLFDILVLPKAILSAADFSYPLRQGVMMAPGHPKEFIRSFTPMFRAAATEKGALAIQDGVLGDPRTLEVLLSNGMTETRTFGQIKDEIGLLRSLDSVSEQAEEAFRGSLAERIPGIGNIVRASNRGFTTFGNKFRSDTFDTIVNNWVEKGVPLTEDRLKALGNMLNRFTGRGTLMNDNRLTQALQATWWAPQYRVSGPEAVAQLIHRDPLIRKEAARNLVAFATTGMAIITAAKMSGQFEVSANPMSSDFGKMKIGNTRFNIWGSSNTLARTVAQIAINMASGDPEKAQASALRYLRSGLAPEWALAVDIANKRNYLGQSMNLGKDALTRELQQRMIPLAAQDISDAVQEAVKNPSLKTAMTAAAGAPLSLFGLGVQTYTSKSESFKEAFKQAAIKGKFGPEKQKTPDYNGQAMDATLAQADPQLAPLYDAWQADQLERGVPSAVEKNERQGFVADTEKQLGLAESAQQILAGNKAVMPQFAKDFEDYQTTVAIASARDMFGVDIQQSDDPRAVAVQNWVQVRPRNYEDPTTGATDWDAYFKARNEAFSKLDPVLQQAIQNKPLSTDPSAQKIETRFKQAKKDVRAYYEIPKYKGLSPEDGERVDEAIRAMDYLVLQGLPDRTAAIYKIKDRLDPKILRFIVQYILPTPEVWTPSRGSMGRVTVTPERLSPQDPRRDEWALKHPDLLYFGLVSLSTLSRDQKQGLDMGFLGRNVDPELVGAY